jgi:O-antigen/teichoic acid export membrane protein
MRTALQKWLQDGLGAAGLRLAAYAAVTAIAAVATFLTTPLLVRFLGLKGFGSYSLIEPLLVTAAGVSLLGADHGVLRRIAYDRVRLREAIGGILPPIAGVLLLVGFLGAWALPRIAGATLSPWLVGVLAPAEAMLLFLTTAFRASNKIGSYAVAQGGRALLVLGSLFLLSRLPGSGDGSIGSVIGVRAVVAFSLVVVFLLYVRPKLRLDWLQYREEVQYGIFVVATSALSAFQENFDRYVIAGAASRETVGGYVVCIKVAAIVGQSVILPLMIWLPAERLRHMQDEDGGERFFRAASLVLFALLLAVGGGVFLCGREAVALIGPGTPYNPTVLLLILAAAIAGGMAHPLNIGLFKPGYSHYNMYPVAIASAIGFCLARLWVGHGGIVSVAAAKTVASLLGVVMIHILSQRFHPVRLDWSRLAILFIVAGVMLAALASDVARPMSLLLKAPLFVLTVGGTTAFLLDRSLRSPSPVFEEERRDALEVL